MLVAPAAFESSSGLIRCELMALHSPISHESAEDHLIIRHLPRPVCQALEPLRQFSAADTVMGLAPLLGRFQPAQPPTANP